ncbi:MAG: choice-of-anchor D domain-containing protein, partial [Deltaproteobacteria bacterium]|nr:choice-of-anchor D domain-containing protein [Deltaproteobacteria bacterium]
MKLCTRTARLLAYALALGALAGCPSDPPVPSAPPKTPGLSADPRWLTFQCIKPGCDTRLPINIIQEGERRIVVKRLVLSEPERTDFIIESEQAAPFVVPGAFELNVRHVPRAGGDPGDVNLLVTYTDATADDSPDRVPPGELSIPLLRRLIGEPTMVATPAKIELGAAWVGGEPATRTVTVENAGYGNIALDVAAVESDSEDVKAGALPTTALLPHEKLQVPIVFTPTAPRFTRAKLLFRSSDRAVKPAEVVAVGTSLAQAKAAAAPPAIDFGEVPRRQARSTTVELMNQGGTDLELSELTIVDGGDNLTASLPGGVETLTLAPLQTAELTVKLTSQTAGELSAQVSLRTDDPSRSLLIPVTGLVIEPKATPMPASLEFGNVFKGWTLSKPIIVENTGWGDLTVLGITRVHGTSDLFSLRTLPTLPATLKRGQRIGLEVEFRADATATFTGAVSVETNDPAGNFLQIPLEAVGTTCDLACTV